MAFYSLPNVVGNSLEVQYNFNGLLSSSSDFTWDNTTKELGIGGDINLDNGGTYSTSLQTVSPTANRVITFPDKTGTVALVDGLGNLYIGPNDAPAVKSDTTGVVGADEIINIMSLTQAEYDAIVSPNPYTFYVITA
jgi:hypothetical protein